MIGWVFLTLARVTMIQLFTLVRKHQREGGKKDQDRQGELMQTVTVYKELWLEHDIRNKCGCRLLVPTVDFLLYQSTLRHLIWSGVKNIQHGHTILILVRKLYQMLPFVNCEIMASAICCSHFTSQFPLSVLSWLFMILILMDVFQCEMT